MYTLIWETRNCAVSGQKRWTIITTSFFILPNLSLIWESQKGSGLRRLPFTIFTRFCVVHLTRLLNGNTLPKIPFSMQRFRSIKKRSVLRWHQTSFTVFWNLLIARIFMTTFSSTVPFSLHLPAVCVVVRWAVHSGNVMILRIECSTLTGLLTGLIKSCWTNSQKWIFFTVSRIFILVHGQSLFWNSPKLREVSVMSIFQILLHWNWKPYARCRINWNMSLALMDTWIMVLLFARPMDGPLWQNISTNVSKKFWKLWKTRKSIQRRLCFTASGIPAQV